MSFKRQPIRHPIAQADSTCRTPAVVFRRIAKSPPQPTMIKAVIQNPLSEQALGGEKRHPSHLLDAAFITQHKHRLATAGDHRYMA